MTPTTSSNCRPVRRKRRYGWRVSACSAGTIPTCPRVTCAGPRSITAAADLLLDPMRRLGYYDLRDEDRRNVFTTADRDGVWFGDQPRTADAGGRREPRLRAAEFRAAGSGPAAGNGTAAGPGFTTPRTDPGAAGFTTPRTEPGAGGFTTPRTDPGAAGPPPSQRPVAPEYRFRPLAGADGRGPRAGAAASGFRATPDAGPATPYGRPATPDPRSTAPDMDRPGAVPGPVPGPAASAGFGTQTPGATPVPPNSDRDADAPRGRRGRRKPRRGRRPAGEHSFTRPGAHDHPGDSAAASAAGPSAGPATGPAADLPPGRPLRPRRRRRPARATPNGAYAPVRSGRRSSRRTVPVPVSRPVRIRPAPRPRPGPGSRPEPTPTHRPGPPVPAPARRGTAPRRTRWPPPAGTRWPSRRSCPS